MLSKEFIIFVLLKYFQMVLFTLWIFLSQMYQTQGALNEPENVIKATCRIKQPCNIPCPLDIPKLLHVGWYCCPKIEECRADWDKHRVAHVQDMKHAYIDYDKYGVQLNGTLTIKKVLPEDDGKTYICRGKIQLSGTVENTTVVTIIEEPPEIYIRNPQETKVMEGMPLTLEGKARGWPYPSISWSRNKKVLAVNRTILILFNATESFNGEYTFTAENPLGTKYVTIKVAVVGSVSDWEKKAFWTLLALVLFLFVIVVVVVVVKKFLQRHEKATPQAKGNAVIDFVDGNWEEKKVFYKVGNKWHDDGHVEGNMLNSNYMTTTSC